MAGGRQADPFSAASGERTSTFRSPMVLLSRTHPMVNVWRNKETSVPAIIREIWERAISDLDKWSMYLITSYDKAENDIGRKADKNRKIYNGMLKTYYYQFLGPRPPKKKN